MSPEFLHINAHFCWVAAGQASGEQGLGPVLPSVCKCQLQRNRTPKETGKK